MIVKVERCFAGVSPCFRLRFCVTGQEKRVFIGNPKNDFWGKGFASLALDELGRLYGIPRRVVRFTHMN